MALLRLNSLVARRYRLLRRLGRGTGGAVYLARDLEDPGDKVLKLLSPRAAETSLRLRMEAALELLAHFPHPAVARVRPLRPLGRGRWYFTYDYIPGVPLDEFLAAPPRRSVPAVARLIASFAGATAHLERLGMVHADVHAGNLICSADGPTACALIDPGQLRILSIGAPSQLSAGLRRDRRSFGRVLLRELRLSEEEARGPWAPIVAAVRRLEESGEPDASAGRAAPLVGRDGALECFDRLLAGARRGNRRGCAVLRVEGDEGAGKTRLLEEFRIRAARQGCAFDEWPSVPRADRTSVIAVDELQRADDPTIERLEALIKRHQGSPTHERVLFVLAYRPAERSDGVRAFLSRLPGGHWGRTLRLDPLSRDEVGILVSHAPGGRDDPALWDRTWRASEGNPAEATRLLADGGAPDPTVARAFERLEAGPQEAVRAACVSVAPVPGPWLERVSGRARFEPWLRADGRGRWRPSSPRIRNSIVAGIDAGRRAGLHRRLMEALSKGRWVTGTALAVALSVHAAGAGLRAAAYRHSMRAARRLLRARADHEAADALRRALEHAPPGARARLLALLVETLLRAGRPLEALEPVDRLVAMHPSAEPWRLKGCVHRDLGQAQEALACFERAVGRAERRPAVGADAAIRSAYLCVRLGRFDPAARLIDEAARYVRRCADPRLEFQLQEVRGTFHYYRHDPAAACVHYRAALRSARALKERRWEANTLVNLAAACRRLGEWDLAQTTGARAERRYEALGLEREAAIARHVAGLVLMDRGRAREAAAVLGRCAEVFARHDDRYREGFCEHDLAAAELMLGDGWSALSRARAARRIFGDLRDAGRVVRCDALIARAQAMVGNHAAAVRNVQAALAGARATKDEAARLQVRLAEAVVGLDLRDAARSTEAAAAAEALAARLGDGVCRVEAIQLKARALLAIGDGPRARREAEASGRLLARYRNARFEVQRRLILAECDALDGKVDSARRRLGALKRGLGEAEPPIEAAAAIARLEARLDASPVRALDRISEFRARGAKGPALDLIGALRARLGASRRAAALGSLGRKIWSEIRREVPREWTQEGDAAMKRTERTRRAGTTDPEPWESVLQRIDLLSADEPSSARVLGRALDEAIRRTGAERGFIVVRDEDGGFAPVAARSIGREEVAAAVGSPSRSIVGRTLESGQPILTADAGADPQLEGVASVREQGIRSALCAPLRAGGVTFGAVYLDHTRAVACFGPRQQTELSLLAYRLALFVENLRLRRGPRPARAPAPPPPERTPAIVSQSPCMDEVFVRIGVVGPTAQPVLIVGETGAGKELVARALHQASPRADKLFIPVDCGSMTETLLGSELFGHLKGAFTGAATDHVGLFEHADGGTVFLDEIANMPPSLQTSLLRFLEDREVRRLGDTKRRRVDVRLIAATNRPPGELIRSGRLREDLYHRLRVVEIVVPPLRRRPEDVPLLARTFFEREGGGATVDPEVYDVLRDYRWPGNVRELRNVVSELALRGAGRVTAALARRVLRERTDGAEGSAPGIGTDVLNLKEARRRLERALIEEALRRSGGNRSRAAALLGIERSHLYRLARHCGLDRRTG
jgi:transcriptional regulator with GAF, ATPase, and Fis domain